MDIFKFFITFVTIFFCFIFWVFWPQGMWDLSSLKRGQIHTPCARRQNPKHWPAREVPHLFIFLINIIGVYLICNAVLLSLSPVPRTRYFTKLVLTKTSVTSKDIRITSRPRIPLPAPFRPRMSLLHPCPPWLLHSLKSCSFYCLWCQPFSTISALKKRHNWKESSNIGKLLLSDSVSSMIRCPTLLLCHL